MSAAAMLPILMISLCLLVPITMSWNPSPACGASYWDDHQNEYEGIDRMESITGVSDVNLVVYSNPFVVWCAAPDRYDSDHLITAIDHCYPRLIAYFNGSNDRQQAINLTIPLLGHVVSNQETNTWQYQVGFKLPYSLGSSIPHPNDATLSIDSLGFYRWTAVTMAFGGKTLTDDTVALALQQLNATIHEQLGIASGVSHWHKAVEVYDPLRLDTDYHWNRVVHWLPLGAKETPVAVSSSASAPTRTAPPPAAPVVLRGIRVDSVAVATLTPSPCATYVLDVLTRQLHAVNASSDGYVVVRSVNVSAFLVPYQRRSNDGQAAITVDPYGQWLYLKATVENSGNQRLVLFELPDMRVVKQWDGTAYFSCFIYYSNQSESAPSEPGLVALRSSGQGQLLQMLVGGSWHNLTMDSSFKPFVQSDVILATDTAQPSLLYMQAFSDDGLSAIFLVYDLQLQRVARQFSVALPNLGRYTAVNGFVVYSAADRLYYVASGADSSNTIVLQAVQLSTNSTLPSQAVWLPGPGQPVSAMALYPTAAPAAAESHSVLVSMELLVGVGIRDELQTVSVDAQGGLGAVRAWTLGRYPTTSDVRALAFDWRGSGDLFVDSSGSLVKRVSSNTSRLRVAFGVPFVYIAGLAVASSETVVVGDGNQGNPALLLNSSSGAVLAQYGLNNPPGVNGIAMDVVHSLLYVSVASVPGGGVSLNLTGGGSAVVATFAAPGTWSGPLFVNCWAINDTDAGEVYVGSSSCEQSHTACIVRFARDGSLLGVVYSQQAVTSPLGLALSPAAPLLYVANKDTQLVGVLDLVSGTSVGVLSGGWQRLDAVAVNASGHVVVAADDALWIFPPHSYMPQPLEKPSKAVERASAE